MPDDYKKRIYSHLNDYRLNVLGIAESGTWHGRQYGHILPTKDLALNILAPYRQDFWKYAKAKGFALHDCFPHLNSSQAMCFNLFYPFLREGLMKQLLTEVLNVPDDDVDDAKFEH